MLKRGLTLVTVLSIQIQEAKWDVKVGHHSPLKNKQEKMKNITSLYSLSFVQESKMLFIIFNFYYSKPFY